MAKAWKDVIASPQYQSLSPEMQAQAQEQYFSEVVAPAAGEQAEQARQAFYSAYPSAASQQAQTNSMWQDTPAPTHQSSAWGDHQKRTNGEQLASDALDVGKGVIQAGVNVLNIPAEMADAFASAGAWAAGKIGLSDGKYTPSPRIELPKAMRPETEGGKLTAEILPYLTPTGITNAAVKGAGMAERLATKGAGMLAENVTGALAQSSGTGQDSEFAGNLATGVAGSAAGQGLVAVTGRVAGPIVKSARKWLSPTQKVISDADDAARAGLSATSDIAQQESAQALGKAAEKGDYSSLAGEIKPQSSILKAATELDMEGALLPSHYSQSQTYRAVEQGLKSVPASQLRAKEYEAINTLAQKADDMIGLAGGTNNKVALSEKFKAESHRAIDELGRRSDSIYSEIGAAIPKRTQVEASSTIEALKAKAEDLGGIGNLSSPERMVLTKLSAKTNEAGDVIHPTYALVDNIRKQIGAAIGKNEGPFKDQTKSELKRIYAALTDDQGKIAEQMGMGDKWGVAKGLTAQRKQLEDHMVYALGKDLSGTLTSKLSPAIQNLRKGDVRAFDKLILSTPPHMRQEVVASALNDIFTLGSRKEKQLSIPGFVDWYEGARKSGSLNRVMKHLPIDARRNLSNIYKVSSGIRRANEEAISTGRLGTLIKAIDSRNGVLEHLHGAAEKGAAVGGGSIGAIAGAAIAGPVGSAIGGAVGAGAGGAIASASGRVMSRPARSVAADQLLADPQFQSALMKANARNQDTVNRVTQNNPAWKRFAGHLSSDEVRQVGRVGIIGWLNGEAD
ncbi:hypothetical protein [Escherichia coli]|uniref:hypothetical protein n=2 Tax=Escherichia coli TaxID=562 RepID=UPI001B310E54|nr:hypothetical protein [Escherichia coli]EKL6558326.1 hypothetical protein [Escherichia coli]EMB9673419.1 hypothetical protein [Escherichia coli]